MEEYKVDCGSCDAEYNLIYDDEDAEIRYCPFCGTEIIDELDFNE